MSSKTAKTAGIVLTTLLLAGGFSQSVAAASGRVETCVVNAVREAPNLAQAVNHCYWDHWDGGNAVQ